MIIKTLEDYKAAIKAADSGTINDYENPAFIFSLTNTSLLTKIVNGDIDIKLIVQLELSNRGLDNNGKWVGFTK